jgi:hypothetical protein
MRRFLINFCVSLLLVLTSFSVAFTKQIAAFAPTPSVSSASGGTTISDQTATAQVSMTFNDPSQMGHSFYVALSVDNHAGDGELMDNIQVVTPTSLGQSFNLNFKAIMLYPGSNWLGCVLAQDDFSSYDYCNDNISINYTGSKFPVYRFWSDQKQHHFFTIDRDEKVLVDNQYSATEWYYEQMAYLAYKYSGSCPVGSPVYRFWSDQKQGHFYTISSAEKDYVIANYPTNVWRYEGVAFCTQPYTGSCPAGTSAVYRFWSDEKQGHFYTISADEKNYVIANYPSNVWRYEGVAYCAWQ